MGVAGDVDPETVGILRAALDAVLRAGERDIWVDLTEVTFIGSACLQALQDLEKALVREHRRLTLICPPASMGRVREFARLDREFTVFPDRAAAQRFS